MIHNDEPLYPEDEYYEPESYDYDEDDEYDYEDDEDHYSEYLNDPDRFHDDVEAERAWRGGSADMPKWRDTYMENYGRAFTDAVTKEADK